MADAKVTPDLEERVRVSPGGEILDVVIELGSEETPPAEGPARGGRPSRGAAIAARKEAFQRLATPVGEAVAAAGGEVRESAWINRTLRVRIAAEQISALTELEGVDRIDVAHRITPEEDASLP